MRRQDFKENKVNKYYDSVNVIATVLTRQDFKENKDLVCSCSVTYSKSRQDFKENKEDLTTTTVLYVIASVFEVGL